MHIGTVEVFPGDGYHRRDKAPSVGVLCGPGNNGATMVPGFMIYDTAFNERRFGYASAIGVILFIITLILTLINMRMTRNVQTEEK